MFNRVTQTTIKIDNASIFIVDFRTGMNEKYSDNKDWQQAYQDDFTFTDGKFSFKNTLIQSKEKINYEDLLPKDSKIKMLHCFQHLGGNKYGSEVTLANNTRINMSFPNPNNDVMTFRVLNSIFLIIPEQPTGKLIICDVPANLLDKNSSIAGYNKPTCKNYYIRMFDNKMLSSYITIEPNSSLPENNNQYRN